jgi:hypothetical protein
MDPYRSSPARSRLTPLLAVTPTAEKQRGPAENRSSLEAAIKSEPQAKGTHSEPLSTSDCTLRKGLGEVSWAAGLGARAPAALLRKADPPYGNTLGTSACAAGSRLATGQTSVGSPPLITAGSRAAPHPAQGRGEGGEAGAPTPDRRGLPPSIPGCAYW